MLSVTPGPEIDNVVCVTQSFVCSLRSEMGRDTVLYDHDDSLFVALSKILSVS
jgi:hypothetical protein